MCSSASSPHPPRPGLGTFSQGRRLFNIASHVFALRRDLHKNKGPGRRRGRRKGYVFMYFLAVLIGPLVKILYSFIGNYAATMIVATLILKLLLFP